MCFGVKHTVRAGGSRCAQHQLRFSSLLQDKVEEADGGGAGAAGRGRELLRPAEDVPVPVLLPAEPGVQLGPRGGPVPVQGPLGAPASSTETPGSADSAARLAGGQRAAARATAAPPHVRRASPAGAAAVSGAQWTPFHLLRRKNKTETEKDNKTKETVEEEKRRIDLYMKQTPGRGGGRGGGRWTQPSD